MGKKSIAKNYIFNLIYQILLIILPIITTPYVAQVLSPNGVGIYGYTSSIATYFVLFGTLGISTFGQREIAYYQDDKDKKSKIFFELQIIKLVTMVISIIIYYLCFCRTGENALYYQILLITLLSNIIDITWFFQGMEDFQKVVLRNLAIKLLSVGCIFIFVKNSNDLWKYVLIYSLSSFIGNLSMWISIFKNISFVKIEWKEMTKYLVPILSLFIPQVAVQVYTVLDKTMIGSILNDMESVGLYEQAEKIVKLTLTLVISLGTVMVPRIANLYKKNDKNQINLYMYKVFNFIWFLATPLFFGLIAISDNLVPWFLGNGYEKVSLLIKILSPLLYAIGLNNVIGVQYLIPTGKQKIFTISVTIGAIINFVMNCICIKILGVLGACISTVLSETIILLYQIYYVKKHKNFDIKAIYKSSVKYLISGSVMFLCSSFVGMLLPATIISTIIQIFVGAIVYILVLVILKDQFFIGYYNKYKNKLCMRR